MHPTVKLRGHHVLCILTYIGKGYTEDFVENFDALIERINHGTKIEIVSGIDEVCQSLHQGAVLTCAHARVCSSARTKNRDFLAVAAIARALQLPSLKVGDKLKIGKGEVQHLRRFFTEGSIRHACEQCLWHQTCTGIARDRFAGARLLQQAIP